MKGTRAKWVDRWKRAAIVPLFPIFVVPVDEARFPVAIQGEKYCAQFDSEPRYLQFSEMPPVVGFAAGAVAVNASPGYALDWLRNYCSANPLDKFATAVLAMRHALEKDPKLLDEIPLTRDEIKDAARIAHEALGLPPP